MEPRADTCPDTCCSDCDTRCSGSVSYGPSPGSSPTSSLDLIHVSLRIASVVYNKLRILASGASAASIAGCQKGQG